MGILLTIIAVLLTVLLFPIGILLTLFINLYKRRWRYAYKNLNEQFISIATSIDASGNVIFEDLFNLLLIKGSGYKFGNRKETISSVLGKNQRDKTLTLIGTALANILDMLDKNHCLNSIDNLI
jgi:8-oxo-dGTP diphosphatase